jgi:hypothetical protein
MKNIKVPKGRFAVISNKGVTVAVIEAGYNLRIEGGDNVAVVEKTLSKLTAAEKGKMKVKDKLQKAK